MPQLMGLFMVIALIVMIVDAIVIPLIMFTAYILWLAILVLALSTLFAFVASAVRKQVSGDQINLGSTHRAVLNRTGELRIALRDAYKPNPAEDGFQLMFALVWCAAWSCVLMYVELAPREIVKTVPAPVWVQIGLAMLISGAVAALLSYPLHVWTGWTGVRSTQPTLTSVSGWESALNSFSRADQAFSELGVHGCFDIAEQMQHHVNSQQRAVIARPDTVAGELAARRTRVVELTVLAEHSLPQWQRVLTCLQDTARVIARQRSVSCLALLDELRQSHSNAAGLLLKGDGEGFDRDMADIHRDALDLQALAATDGAGPASAGGTCGGMDVLSLAYQTLGVANGHPLAQVKAIAQRLMQTYHPDKGYVGGDDRRFKEIQRAWETIARAAHSGAPA